MANMNKMKMEKRMVIYLDYLDFNWVESIYDMCEGFLQTAAQMQPDDYLGFEVVKSRDQGYYAGAFTSAPARITYGDYARIFDYWALVDDLSELPEKEFEDEKQYLYVVKRQGHRKAPRSLKKNHKSFSKRLEEFVDVLSSHNASLRIVARPGRKNGRGSFYISLPEIMSHSVEASIMKLFPGTVISKVQGCNDEIPKTNWLTQTQMIDGMMGMVGIFNKFVVQMVQNLVHDELFKVDWDEFDVIDEEETSRGEEKRLISRNDCLEDLYTGLRSEECPIPGDTSIDELEFSAKTYYCLKMHGIKTAAALFALTEVDLHNLWLSEDGMWEIRDKRKALKSMNKREMLQITE